MTRIRAILIAGLLVASLSAVAVTPAAASHDGEECSFPLTVTDDTGSEVTLNASADTVVAGDAASAQTLWEVGAADAVVGMPVREYTAYLEGSRNRTDVLTGDGTALDVETIIELDADLVVVPNYVSDDTVEKLRNANQTVYRSPFESSFEDIYAKTELYGHFVGNCEAGNETAAETRETVDAIRETVDDRDRPDVLYYFFGTAAGNGTFIGQMVETAGGTNIAAEAGIDQYGEISDEVILEANPEWVVTTDDEGAFDAEAEPFPSTNAVQNDRVLRVDANLVSQAGPRVVEPLRTMAEAFHTEAFATQTQTPTQTQTTTDATREETPGSTDGDGAFAGVIVAILAVLAVGLGVRRR